MLNYFWISIQGKNTKRILTTLIKQNINIEEIKYEKDRLILKISYEDYKKMKNIRTSYKIEIIKTVGKKRIKDLYQKYKVSIFILVISIFFIIFLSKQILFINIETDNRKLKEIIKEELNKNDITLFTIQKNYKSLKEISTKIKQNNLNTIEWIELEQKGTILNAKVIERVNKKEKEDNTPKDIVASKNGYIRKIYSRKGQLMKNIDDYVKKGEIIISGNIIRNEKSVGTVKAEGKIYAEVWYIVKVNKKTEIIKAIEKEYGKESLQLIINKHKLNIISFPKKVPINKKKNIFKNKTFELVLNKEKKYNLEMKKYKSNELQKLLETKAKHELLQTLEKDEYIMSQKTLKKSTINGKMYIEVFFKVYENIALEKDIQEIKDEKDE